MHKALIFCFLLVFSVYSNAQISQEARDISLSCPENKEGDSLGFCQYTIQNLNRAQALIAKVNQALFNGRPISSAQGILQPFGENEQQLLFWHNDDVILNKMKIVIPLLDTLENFTTYSIVEVKTDIYEISESGLSSLGAEISNLKLGNLFDNSNDSEYGISANQTSFGLDLKIGTLQLQGLISAEKSRGTLNRKGTIIRTVPNLSSLSYSDTTPIYFAPGAGTNVLSPETGVKLSGKVSINSLDNSLVSIKDYQLYYGTLTETNNVNSVVVPFDNLILEEGVSFPIVSSKSIGTMKVRKRGILSFGNSTTIEDSKLLVYTSVKVFTWEEYLKNIRDLVVEPKLGFSLEEIETLDDNCINNLDVINDIDLHSKRDQVGDPILSINLKKENACKSNLKQKVRITIKGENIDQTLNTTITTFERAMHLPVRIKGISPRAFTKASLNFKLKIETLGAVRSRVIKYLEFAPSIYDLEDMFWEK